MPVKIFSFFSGAGFLDLGFEKNGFEIELVNEFHPAFKNAYRYARERMHMPQPRYGYWQGDINAFLGEKQGFLHDCIEDARKDDSLVGFIGGPPCPDFSVAGKQHGRNGENGKLSLSYVNLIIAMSPDFFLFENVKGLWSTKRHRTYFEELKSMLHDAGYLTTERLTNSLEYGAPQDRDRILMFGIRSSVLTERFPGKSIDNFPWMKYQTHTLSEINDMPWPETDPYREGSVSECPDGIPEEMTVEYWFRKNDVENHPNGRDYFMPKAGRTKMELIAEGDDRGKSYKRLHRWRYSPTAAYGNNEVHLHPYRTRRLSAAEALAIQTLPKEFVLPPDMTLTDKFKTIGNGVPYVLSCGIAGTVRDFLTSS